MFQEYDVVIAKRTMDNVPKGAKGTVLIVYEGGKHYEVEFFDTEDNSINTITVGMDDIIKREATN